MLQLFLLNHRKHQQQTRPENVIGQQTTTQVNSHDVHCAVKPKSVQKIVLMILEKTRYMFKRTQSLSNAYLYL